MTCEINRDPNREMRMIDLVDHKYAPPLLRSMGYTRMCEPCKGEGVLLTHTPETIDLGGGMKITGIHVRAGACECCLGTGSHHFVSHN